MPDYTIYDVFTDTPYTGNPLAVVTGADNLDTAAMQTIAREFNFSETTFVLPPEDPAHTARVRIFTPTLEMAFAGHPTIGTAIALHEAGGADRMVFELGVGPIPVTITDGVARFVTKVPLQTGAVISPDDVASCIGLDADQVRTDRHPPTTAGLGADFVLTEVTDTAALDAAQPDTQAFRRVAGAEADRLAMLIYLRDGTHIRARMFQPLGGIPEDPATGSAAAALAGFLGQLDGASATFTISQGVQMGRASTIGAEVTVEDGAPVAVAISGRAVRVMEGRLIR